MTLPIDLVLVRHGESEMNVAIHRSENGDHSAYTPAFRERHTSNMRLTDLGQKQAILAGEWLRSEFPAGFFHRFVASEYARATETAALLGLPGANWYRDFYLRERDWGQKDVEPFYWIPFGGESLAALCQRIDLVLELLRRECSEKRVIIVCHGEVMLGFRIRIEKLSQTKFKEIYLSPKQEDRIKNCQILHYTRRDPQSGAIARHIDWMRMVRPAVTPIWTTGWREIVRPRYTNDDLLNIVSEIPRAIR
ncbi:MAG: phosphoglycerate mutase family protein [Candidatus Niyogibacteria bacterium]|nr:phosphoglycerate mutase family protein [Candidatus Niyogibacteria bacterium]